MNKLVELREKRASLWNDAKVFLESHRDWSNLLSDENEKVYRKMMSDVVKMGDEIERLEEQAHIDRDMVKGAISDGANKSDYFIGHTDGMRYAWTLANRIVHLDWDGRYCTADTVEEWFEKLSPEEAEKELKEYDRMQAPHWKRDVVRGVCECSVCGEATVRKTPFCPMCGAKMGCVLD